MGFTLPKNSDLLFKKLLMSYLLAIFLIVFVPLGGFGKAINQITVFSFRLDYLLHSLLLLPLVIFWRLGFPKHPLWHILAAATLLAGVLEGIQYVLPYRTFNVNDLVWDIAGVALGGMIMGVADLTKSKVDCFGRKSN